MGERTYWSGRRIGRRAALRGAGVGIAGLAGAALIGCGGDDEATPAATAATGGEATATAATGETGGGPVSADQIRVAPGAYINGIPPTPAEQAPLVNGRYGGTLTERYLDPPSMDFNRTLSCTINTSMDYTKNKLVRAVFGPKANPSLIDVEPDLAESWEVSPDNTEFTFHIRQGVKFHNVPPVDGREFTSADVKASVERYMAGGVQRDVWSPVVSMETPDDYTVKFTLDQPFVDFPRNIAAWSHMDAQEIIADEDFLKEHAIGTGPFIQEEWAKKERSVFAKHPEYFEEGLPFLDKVIAIVQNDTASLRAGFQTDNFQSWTARDAEDAESMLNQVDDAVYVKYERAQGTNTNGFHFQMTNPKFQDERVRRAFSMGFDRVEYDLARYVGEGGGYSTVPIAWQILHDSLPTLESQGPWYQFNQQEASLMLQAAGYTADNPIEADAPVWYKRNEYRELIGPSIAGVPELSFNVREVDNPTAVQMLNDRNFDDTMNVTWGPPSYSVDQVVYPWYFSEGGLNQNNVNDPEMDKLVVAQRGEANPEAQREIWTQIEARILDQVTTVFFPEIVFGRELFHNGMINYRRHGIGNMTCYGNAQARAIWLDEGAAGAS